MCLECTALDICDVKGYVGGVCTVRQSCRSASLPRSLGARSFAALAGGRAGLATCPSNAKVIPGRQALDIFPTQLTGKAAISQRGILL